MKTLLVMAGGTGGHVIPALAVAKDLRARGVKIIWMGTRSGIEHELVPAAGIDLRLVQVSGIRGSGLLRKLTAPFVLLLAALQALNIIITSKANAVLGMGGFVSGPGGVVARLLSKPLVLHEQNAIAGTTNRLLAPWATRVLTGFAGVPDLRKQEHIGNPVKTDIVALADPAIRLADHNLRLNILIVGGSQGAMVFNQKLPRLLAKLESELADEIQLTVHHQCGKGNATEVKQYYAEVSQTAKVSEFIDDMAAAYAWSDIVICRAGAMTVAEIAAAGTVALFVPFPYAIDDHQFYNAKAMVDAGAAFCERQEVFLSGKWTRKIKGLVENRDRLIQMAQKARQFAKPDATERVADICLEVMNA